MRKSSSFIPSLLVTATNLVLLTGCAASPALERPDDVNGSTQRSAPPSAPSPFAQPPAGEESNDESAAIDNLAPKEALRRAEAPSNGSPSESKASAPEGARNDYARESAPRSPTYERSAPSSASESRSRGATAYKSSPAKPSLPTPEVRPGLGTTWGETRTSSVRPVDFARESDRDPFALFRIFYNDQTGLLAQTGERSFENFSPNYTESPNRFVSVEIVDPSGSALLGLNQNNGTYVLGRDGDRYAIRVRNHERQRFEVVATVDGLDVIDGTKGHFGKRGYILDAYGTLMIEGFRRSGSSVAAFRFGSVADSYAARTSGDRNVGVIGVALFAERNPEPVYTNQEIERRETADPFPNQYARPPRARRIDEYR